MSSQFVYASGTETGLLNIEYQKIKTGKIINPGINLGSTGAGEYFSQIRCGHITPGSGRDDLKWALGDWHDII
jgi:hypothetical protein